ncbi:hypothetical protein LTR70_005503 [Exophiala xenobiotica]|uniref:Uncharacterized protein n=1 Tax=Lithohypha guttulata TaxID=1690604 RepID=A0ABR0KE94_9EURO|nr:hypothetical protein LTR24_003870 [Lithohypha guttulata]KAK5318360.1 hypothetical protein LTR70_005503 [Exophiala xenobiotica]
MKETIGPDFKPLHNICEFLNAVHIYADEARQGQTRTVEAHHFCSHVRKDLRQCLIYDSGKKDARLIGVEYMVPKHVYETLDPEEQKLWHSHEFEVSSGMLCVPRPSDGPEPDKWEEMETEVMKEVAGFQIDLDAALARRNKDYGVDHKKKAMQRMNGGVKGPGIHENADSWWKESRLQGNNSADDVTGGR